MRKDIEAQGSIKDLPGSNDRLDGVAGISEIAIIPL